MAKNGKNGVPVATTARKREASQGFIALMAGISLVAFVAVNHVAGYVIPVASSRGPAAALTSIPVALLDFARSPWALSLDPAAVAVGLAGPAAVVLVYLLGGKKADKPTMAGMEHGTARWGEEDEKDRHADTDNPLNNIPLAQGVELCLDPDAIGTRRKGFVEINRNVMCFGPPGTGKTFYLFVPALLRFWRPTDPSSITSDTKGTTVKRMLPYLMRHDRVVKVLNTKDPSNSHGYNPLKYTRNDLEVLIAVDTIMGNTTGRKPDEGVDGDFWEKSEKSVFVSIIGGLRELKEIAPGLDVEVNIPTMADILLTAEASSDDEDPNTPTTIDRFFALIEHLKPDSYACRTYKGLKLAGKGRTMNSILVSCAVRLMPFNLPVIRELMWRDEMEIDRIPFEGTNLFVVADDAGGQLDFVLAMFYQQTFRTLYNIADNLPGERFPVPVVSFIDEMLNMGNTPYKERILMTARSRNMPIVMGLQSMDLAKEKWGENILGAILDACDTIVYMGGGRSKESRAYISESLGTQTVYEHTVSETVSARIMGSNDSAQSSYQSLGRPLLDEAEVDKIPREQCIVHFSGAAPLMVGKYRTQDTDEYKDSPFAPDRRGEAVTGPFPLQEMREHNARVRASLAA